MKVTISDANFPRDEEERVYHLALKKGEIANRILTVGDPERARKIATFLDSESDTGHAIFEKQSQRGFLTITGRYQGVPVSIVSIGMGSSMMDFFVREARACIEGTMAVIRFGSCGSLSHLAPTGAIIVPKGGYFIRRNLDYYADQPNIPEIKDQPYLYSGVFYADQAMNRILTDSIVSAMEPLKMRELGVGPVVTGGLNAEGCSFYSSQGRQDNDFRDENVSVLQNIKMKYPSTQSVEMEASTLFHLAHCARNPEKPIRAASCMQVFADRVHNGFIRPEAVNLLEPVVGKACLQALVQVSIKNEMPTKGTVWESRKL